MSSVIRSLVVKVGADLTGAQKGLNQFSKDLKKAGKEISSVGSDLTKGVTVPIVGAIAGLTGMAVKASETADGLLTMSSQLGISTGSLQKLQYAARFVDVEVETMAKGMAKTTKAMGTATAAGNDYIEIADGMTVSTKDANGNLKDSEQMFYDTVDALGSMKDETQREIAAQELFGKSYQDLMPLIDAGSGALKKYGDEAENVGAVLDDKTVNSLGSFNDMVEKIKAVVETAGTRIGAAFVPVLEKLTPIIEEKIVPAIAGFADKISGLIDWFSNLDPGMQTFILRLIGLLAAAGPVLSIVGKMTTGLSGVFKAVSAATGAFSAGKGLIGALSALMGPAGIALAVIAAIAAAAFLIYDNWEGISKFFSDLWGSVLKIVENAVNGIIGIINLIPGIDIDTVDLDNSIAKANKTSTGLTTTSTNARDPIPRLASGTNYFPYDGYAFLHQGEAVVPKEYNNSKNAGGIYIDIHDNKISNDYDVDRIGNELVKKLKLAGVIA